MVSLTTGPITVCIYGKYNRLYQITLSETEVKECITVKDLRRKAFTKLVEQTRYENFCYGCKKEIINHQEKILLLAGGHDYICAKCFQKLKDAGIIEEQ